ncbi:ras association domain-containing protein 10 [Caerostris darwini]|uniref:Ras association domain-containing protein 10 n=1 Tax=Caerostris darwini TaxID=1538125 RepID=A0AAV4TKS2_9ARAC|nr:ras association domain-containing protein 10 [Caerostris darwini]
MGTEIPLWIGGLQKWVTGVTKQTTCEEIIKAVLSANENYHYHKNGTKTQRDHKNYIIVERWHKVEKPLDPRSRLLKVWNTWGLEQCNVDSSSKGLTMPKPQVLRLVTSSHIDGSVGCYLDDDDHFPATEEQLRNLISSQSDAIASQLKRLRSKDEEIEQIENEIHTQRMHQIGANYVLDTYLAESSEGDTSNSSGVQNGTTTTTEDNNSKSTNATCDIFDHCIELYEKVLQICDQVHQEEMTIKELTHKIQQSIQMKDKETGCKLLIDDDPELAYASSERLEEILNRTRIDIERLLRINQTQQLTIQQNEKTLVDCAKIIEDKHYYLQHLKLDLDRLDKDNLRLQEEFSAVQVISVDRNGTCDPPENGDSNSDTGLSSLHSSSDDGANVWIHWYNILTSEILCIFR